MPAQNRLAKRKNGTQSSQKTKRSLRPFMAFALTLIALFIIFLILPQKWNTKDRVSLVVEHGKENVEVIVFDPQRKVMTSILIPGNTQIDLAYNLGTWKLESVWELGRNEGLDGQLLADSITKSFHLPIDHWGESNISKIVGGFFEAAPVIFSNSNTDLQFKDKLNLAIFTTRLPASDKRVIDLRNTGYLAKTLLKGSGEGYVISNELPASLSSIFSLSLQKDLDWKVKIIDSSDKVLDISNLSEIISNIGAKVTFIEERDVQHFFCRVSGTNAELVSYFEALFDCELEEVKSQGFGAALDLGSEFSTRF